MSKQLTLLNDNDPGRWDDKFDLIVKWYNDEREEDDPRKIKLPAPLFEQIGRWNWLYAMVTMPKNRYKSDPQLIKLLRVQYPDLSERTARRTLRDMRRFFGAVEQPELAWEKIMLIAGIKETIRKAGLAKDFRAVASAQKNLASVLGADKTAETVENKTIINVINFNPVQLGAIPMSQEALDSMIEEITNYDKKKAENPFDDFTDVTDQPAA
ncbi:hypothetical protein [Spirosoma sp.]|uniref:hypothetical protein n=1 Tax=Spirosoma sp. TaxID=1899569 RepID=UPI002627AF84|nr:hypothetical protein [Spirosoma sp.]MCX6216480.1 hypothetical protein [Spirosoma sp.]